MAIPHSKLTLLRAFLIVTAGCWVFAPAMRGDWLMDDDMYLTQNVLLNDPARLWKIWFVPGSLTEYYPIEATLQAVQWHFWHTSTLGYHLTNLILHLVNGLLLWRLFAKFGLRFAWLGGLLFVIHPAVVDSVAWISELKNTLSLAPFLLAMDAWIDYDEYRRATDYYRTLGLFILAMLCKISMAPFPPVMLLYAWWKRGRVGWGDMKAAAPFFVVSLVLGLGTLITGYRYHASRLETIANPVIGGFASHIALAGWSIAVYFAKCLWPAHPLFIYPKWSIDPGAAVSYLPWPVLIAGLGWLWYRRRTWGRHALLGVGFFLLMLLPFVGFNSVTYMQFTWVMDHFLYLPIIGLIGLAIAALGEIEVRLPERMQPVLAGITAMVLGLLAWESHDYDAIFVGPEALWTHTVAHNPGTYIAHNNLGTVFLETGRVPEAITEFEKALQLNPGMPEALNDLGVAHEQMGQTSKAIENYEEALKVSPHFWLAKSNLATLLARNGRVQEAIELYEQDLLVDPNNPYPKDALARLKALPAP